MKNDEENNEQDLIPAYAQRQHLQTDVALFAARMKRKALSQYFAFLKYYFIALIVVLLLGWSGMKVFCTESWYCLLVNNSSKHS